MPESLSGQSNVTYKDALTVECPWCNALIGERCHKWMITGLATKHPHPERKRVVRDLRREANRR